MLVSRIVELTAALDAGTEQSLNSILHKPETGNCDSLLLFLKRAFKYFFYETLRAEVSELTSKVKFCQVNVVLNLYRGTLWMVLIIFKTTIRRNVVISRHNKLEVR